MKKNILIMLILSALLLSGCGSDSEKTDGTANTATEHTHEEGTTGLVYEYKESGSEKGNLVKEGDTYKITDEKFIDAVNEVYKYPDEFVGKRIEFEGEYMAEMYENEMYYQVYRNVREHCHEDHDHSADTSTRVGFRIKYDGDKPTDKSFVKVSGIVEKYESDGTEYLIINADVLKKCDVAGIVEFEQ